MSETAALARRARPGAAGGAPAMIFRKLDGSAKDASTIPPADAISWRRLTSIVTLGPPDAVVRADRTSASNQLPGPGLPDRLAQIWTVCSSTNRKLKKRNAWVSRR